MLSSDEMREALAEPRQVPRVIREYMAEIILRELALGEDYVSRDPAQAARRLGPLFDIFLAVRHTEEWAELRHIASVSPGIALICARNTLSALLDAFEDAATKGGMANVRQDMDAFIWLIRDTLTLWGRRPGGSNMPAPTLETPR